MLEPLLRQSTILSEKRIHYRRRRAYFMHVIDVAVLMY